MRSVANAEKEIRRIAAVMEVAETKGELGEILAREVKRYSQHDLMVMGAQARKVIDILPQPYREAFRPYADKWFFGRYHKLLLADRNGAWEKMTDPITDRETFVAYCRMFPDACLREDDDTVYLAGTEEREPFYRLFYYLISAYAMYVCDEPSHPEGTPFPGGFKVYRKDGVYYCPIRDKEEEIWHSVCNFCPAKQDPENE